MNRAEIIDKLNAIEQNFDVVNLRFNDIDLWPILKMTLFSQSFKGNRTTTKSSLLETGEKILNRIKLELEKKVQQSSSISIDKTADILFSTAKTYRTIYEGKSYDKFTDPIMDKLELSNLKVLQAEYTKVPQNVPIYKHHRVLDASSLYIKNNSKTSFAQKDFLERADVNLIIENAALSLNLSKTKLTTTFMRYVKETLEWRDMWIKLLDSIRPKIVLGVCYYNVNMFGLSIACTEKGIPFIDIQHGGQGNNHYAYNYKIKEIANLNTIPSYFWVWSHADKNNLESWLNDKSYRALIGGNPWQNFIQTKGNPNTAKEFEKITKNKNVILYTLQHSLPNIFPSTVKYAIKNTPSEFIWWFRLHPRMPKSQKTAFLKELNSLNLQKNYYIEDIHKFPLPYLLNRSYAHISKFSGSLSEAAMAGIQKNYSIDPLSLGMYEYLFDNNKIKFIEPSDEKKLYKELFIETNTNTDRNKLLKYNYNKLIIDAINKRK